MTYLSIAILTTDDAVHLRQLGLPTSHAEVHRRCGDFVIVPVYIYIYHAPWKPLPLPLLGLA